MIKANANKKEPGREPWWHRCPVLVEDEEGTVYIAAYEYDEGDCFSCTVVLDTSGQTREGCASVIKRDHLQEFHGTVTLENS